MQRCQLGIVELGLAPEIVDIASDNLAYDDFWLLRRASDPESAFEDHRVAIMKTFPAHKDIFDRFLR